MRAFLPILALLCLTGVGFAQQVQEKKLIDRLTRPDTSLEFDLRNSSFNGGKSVGTKDARSKSYLGSTTFKAKDFNARTYAGMKDARLADRQFAAKEANSRGKYEIPGLSKTPATPDVATTTWRESAKGARVQEYADAHRGAKGGDPGKQGRSQEQLTREGPAQGTTPVGWTGNMKQMTIDDIRELLNKNK